MNGGVSGEGEKIDKRGGKGWVGLKGED